jgi:DNA-binding HxlR family transcriptional regulator
MTPGEVVDLATQNAPRQTVFDRQYGSREVLTLLAEKWVTLVLYALAEGTKRHGELRREIPGISQKMLTQTLRRLERDGLVARTLYPEVPPHVDYALTPLGQTLGALVCAICDWAVAHYPEIEAARATYDRQPQRTGER